MMSTESAEHGKRERCPSSLITHRSSLSVSVTHRSLLFFGPGSPTGRGEGFRILLLWVRLPSRLFNPRGAASTLPPHPSFPAAGLRDLFDGAGGAAGLAEQTAAALIEVHPGLFAGRFAEDGAHFTLLQRRARLTVRALVRLYQGSSHTRLSIRPAQNQKTFTRRLDYCRFGDICKCRFAAKELLHERSNSGQV